MVRWPRPGEISLAHRGVLFLDELPEFGSRTLEVLRQPMEDHVVTISRAAGALSFPASFMLIASMNPCPCGYYGDPTQECTCSLGMVSRYQKRIPSASLRTGSGPLLDRIDIHVEASSRAPARGAARRVRQAVRRLPVLLLAPIWPLCPCWPQ